MLLLRLYKKYFATLTFELRLLDLDFFVVRTYKNGPNFFLCIFND